MSNQDPSEDAGQDAKPADWKHWTYAEKVAWRCANPDPGVDYQQFVDKAQVKETVSGCFEVPANYQVVPTPELIDTTALPSTFVMKATHGWDMTLLVRDGVLAGTNRSTQHAGQPMNAKVLREIATAWFQSEEQEQRQQRQRHYQQVAKGLLFEQFIEPVDYELQLFLFNGKCALAMVFYRGFRHFPVTHQLYDERWCLLEPGSAAAADSFEREKGTIKPPPNGLLHSLEKLVGAIGHVRADFLVSRGRYFFSEFTFTHNGGRGPGLIGKYDRDLGLHWMP